jgi:ribosomal protein S18 acetylase RimI-like enzyme
MQAAFRTYDPTQDFMRIRAFLIDTYALYGGPHNWLIDRWNFCRYVVVPLHTFYNVQYFGVPTQTHRPIRDELPLWESTIGIWENARGEIVGVVHSENEEPGEAWIQIHPDYAALYDDMVTYIESNLINVVGDIGYVKLYVNESSELRHVASSRGYKKLERSATSHLEYTVADAPSPELPEGFVIRSVREEDDVDKRRRAKAIAFGAHYCPSDWPSASAFEEVQRAPDYRKDLDLFVVAPNGEYAAFCTVWMDEQNGYGNFEPVGTHVEYQRMGLGRALLMEGFHRMAEYGATRSYMDSGSEFYRRVGFRPTDYSYCPWIKYFTG